MTFVSEIHLSSYTYTPQPSINKWVRIDKVINWHEAEYDGSVWSLLTEYNVFFFTFLQTDSAAVFP